MSPTSPPIHRQTHTTSSLPTRSVTIYPIRAAVVRDLPNLVLKPGRNEIVFRNLTQYADEHSIKVEGRGTDALVTDMTVSRGAYEYDSDDEPEENNPSEAEDLKRTEYNLDEVAKHDPSLKSALEAQRAAEKQVALLEDELLSTKEQRSYLSNFASTQSGSTRQWQPEEFLNILQTYATERPKFTSSAHDLEQQIKTAKHELNKLELRVVGLAKPLRDRHDRKEQLKAQKRAELDRETTGIPSSVIRVTITLEAPENLPAGAEERAVAAVAPTGKPRDKSDELPPKEAPDKPYLRISYITASASWSPRYDLRLDTTQKTGVLTYRALFTNLTGEVWRDANIVLSTSQNTFQGLQDKVPELTPWQVGLKKKSAYKHEDFGMLTIAEIQARVSARGGGGDNELSGSISYARKMRRRSAIGMPSLRFSRNDHEESRTNAPMDLQDLVAGQASAYDPTIEESYDPAAMAINMSQNEYFSGPSSTEAPPAQRRAQNLRLATTENVSHGTTTTFTLPGARTVTTSPVARQHTIAELQLENVLFTHHCVPKLRESVFLSAAITIPTSPSTNLLNGTAGLTLDGSFLGTTDIPRVSAGETFELGLGVDEALQVKCLPPVRKQATQGMMLGFNKENVVVYRRNITVKSARQGQVKVIVLDQIPVSEEEKLKISVLSPRGLIDVGNSAKVSASGGAGDDAESFASDSTATGKRSSVVRRESIKGASTRGSKIGQVSLEKNGEVKWEVELGEKQKEAKLLLEYEARMPSEMEVAGR